MEGCQALPQLYVGLKCAANKAHRPRASAKTSYRLFLGGYHPRVSVETEIGVGVQAHKGARTIAVEQIPWPPTIPWRKDTSNHMLAALQSALALHGLQRGAIERFQFRQG